MIANPSIPHKEVKAMRNIAEEPSNKSVLDSTFSSGGAGCKRPQEISTEKNSTITTTATTTTTKVFFNQLKNTVKEKNYTGQV